MDQNANMNAWQRMAGATNAQNEGDFAVWQGNQGGGGGGLLAAGTILGGIGQGIGAYNSWNSTKTPASKVGGKPPVSGSTISRGYVSKNQKSL